MRPPEETVWISALSARWRKRAKKSGPIRLKRQKNDGQIHQQRRKNLDKNFYRYAHHQETGGSRNGKRRATRLALFTGVRPGNVLFEVDGLDEATSREALRKGGSKLPVKIKIIKKIKICRRKN